MGYHQWISNDLHWYDVTLCFITCKIYPLKQKQYAKAKVEINHVTLMAIMESIGSKARLDPRESNSTNFLLYSSSPLISIETRRYNGDHQPTSRFRQ